MWVVRLVWEWHVKIVNAKTVNDILLYLYYNMNFYEDEVEQIEMTNELIEQLQGKEIV